MPRYIDADALLSDIERTIEENGCVNHEGEIMDCVRYATTLSVEPVVYGEWIKNEVESEKHVEAIYYCSACENFEAWGETEKHPFCPNCGAHMDGMEAKL